MKLVPSTISSFLLWTAIATCTDAFAPFRYHVKQQEQAAWGNPRTFTPLSISSSSSSSESSTSPSTTTSWSDYKERNIDPSLNLEDHHHHRNKDQLLHGPNVDEEHRQSADKYWEEISVHEKNKLKQMNKVDPWWMGMRTSQTSWDAYTKDAIIDRTTSTTNQHDDRTSTINHGPGPGRDVISEQQKEESYQFWLATLKENKERLHRMEDPWKLQSTDTKLPSIMTPLEQYQHRFLDGMEESHHHHHTSPTFGESAANNDNNNNQELRTKSDEFWLQSFLEDKLKIHANEKKETETEVSSSSPYEKYQHLHLDSIVEQDRRHERRHQDEFGLSKTAISKEQRHKADEFWLQTFLEAKAKLHQNEDKDVDVTP